MSNLTEQAAAGNALLLCKDELTCRLVIESLRQFAIRGEICEEPSTAAVLLDNQKFEAVIVDLLLGAPALLVMEQLRFSRSNRTAVTFAITAGEPRERTPDSTFVLQRPLTAASVTQTLRAAYGLLVRERRRYFRCPVSVPAYVGVRAPEELLCQTLNISEGGIAICCSTASDSDRPARIRFRLPERSSQLLADTKVRWRGERGLFGLEFQSLSSPQRSDLQEWLARKLDDSLPESVVALFRNVGQSPS